MDLQKQRVEQWTPFRQEQHCFGGGSKRSDPPPPPPAVPPPPPMPELAKPDAGDNEAAERAKKEKAKRAENLGGTSLLNPLEEEPNKKKSILT